MSKFKNEEELLKAYQSLEKEFTKKSQKLAILEKSGEIKNLKIILDSAIEQYDQLAKEYAVIKAIECLEDVVKHIKEKEFACYEAGSYCCYSGELVGHIYTKISELRGNREWINLRTQKI